MQLKLRPTGRLNVQVRHFRESDGKHFPPLIKYSRAERMKSLDLCAAIRPRAMS